MLIIVQFSFTVHHAWISPTQLEHIFFSYIYTTYKMNPTDAEIAEDDKTSDS